MFVVHVTVIQTLRGQRHEDYWSLLAASLAPSSAGDLISREEGRK